MDFDSIYKNNTFTHHAFLLSGEKEEIILNLKDFLHKKLKIETTGNPDVRFFDFESIGILESRQIKDEHSKLPIGEKKFFIVSFNNATFEAQNALLKTFEDPGEHTIFFVVVQNEDRIIPTLRSRFYKIQITGNSNLDKKDVKNFLKLPKAKRLSDIKGIIESKDKSEALSFLSSIESELHKMWKKNITEKEIKRALQEVIEARGFINDRASSIKLILEHVALSIPHLS